MAGTDKQTGSAGGNLIDQLVDNLEPVKPIKTARLFAICFGVQALVALLAAWVFGIGTESFARLSDPAFFVLTGTLALSSAGCTIVALRSSIPGRGVSRTIAVVLLLVPVLLAAGVWITSPWGGTWHGTAHLLDSGKICMSKVTGIAVVPWLGVLAVLRWLAPLREIATGMFIGLSAFSLGALAVQLSCDVNDHYHLAFAHYAPVVVGTLIAGLVSAALLRRSRQS